MQAGFFVGIRLARSHQKRGAEAPLVLCSPPIVGRVVDQLIELAAALALVTTSGGRET